MQIARGGGRKAGMKSESLLPPLPFPLPSLAGIFYCCCCCCGSAEICRASKITAQMEQFKATFACRWHIAFSPLSLPISLSLCCSDFIARNTRKIQFVACNESNNWSKHKSKILFYSFSWGQMEPARVLFAWVHAQKVLDLWHKYFEQNAFVVRLSVHWEKRLKGTFIYLFYLLWV